MGFKKPTLENAYSAIRSSLGEIRSPYNDGWTARACKQELYVLKYWLEDEFKKLPTFVDEEKWEQDRLVEILKK